mmetsp:Transcript_19685/g.42799  ORF Transcript_19685/g.42799 Transcript_19685/m.42799 type:complete len:101 (-) Transcript_19685:105-407(-)
MCCKRVWLFFLCQLEYEYYQRKENDCYPSLIEYEYCTNTCLMLFVFEFEFEFVIVFVLDSVWFGVLGVGLTFDTVLSIKIELRTAGDGWIIPCNRTSTYS